MSEEDAPALYAASRAKHAARDVAGSIELARRAVDLDPAFAEALEHLGTVLVTRRHAFAEGLAFVEAAVAARPDDAGLWYSLGWCSEFAAHEIARRGGPTEEARVLYERAADAFGRCLELHPDGKLQGDAEDLLAVVENVLEG